MAFHYFSGVTAEEENIIMFFGKLSLIKDVTKEELNLKTQNDKEEKTITTKVKVMGIFCATTISSGEHLFWGEHDYVSITKAYLFLWYRLQGYER